MHGPADTKARPVVMIAEDEFLVALDMSETVEIAGYGIEGPHATVQTAEEALAQVTPDCAVLDINLYDHDVFPLADKLQAAHVPIIFHSAHGQKHDLQERYPDAQLCEKPCPPSQLLDIIRATVKEHETA